MSRLMSWRPINCDRWSALAAVTASADQYGADNLIAALARLRVSWERLRNDLEELFVPSGPVGTHAHHHYHAPVDPEQRESVLAACVVDYESALLFLDIALDLSARCVGALTHSNVTRWKHHVTAAEKPDSGYSGEVRRRILYMQRTVLYARNFAVAHPQDHTGFVRYDNVGNITFCRMVREPDAALMPKLDELLHRARPEMSDDHHVGVTIDPHLALTWIGSNSGLLNESDRKAFTDLREALGYWLPGPYEVAPAVDALVEDFIAMLPAGGFGDIALRGRARDSMSTSIATEEVAAPRLASAEEVKAEVNGGVVAGNDGDHVTAAGYFRRAVELDPENGDAHWLLAEALAQLGEYDESLERFAIARSIGVSSAHDPQSQVLALFNGGATAYQRSAFSEAASYYRRVLDFDPSDSQARAHLAIALARAEHIDAALLEAEKALVHGLNDPWVQFEVGAVLAKAGNDSAAIPHYDAAIALRPDWMDAHLNRALALIRRGQLDDGVAGLRDALALDPPNAEIQNLLTSVRPAGEETGRSDS